MSDTKKPWQSKTLLLNGIVGLMLCVGLFFPQVSVVTPWIQAHGAEIGTAWSVLNVVLRLISKDKISLTD
jgi:hypothetical protein